MDTCRWIFKAVLIAAVSLPFSAHADNWRERCQSGKFLCVDVDVADNGATATASLVDPLSVSKGQKVVWRLPMGFVFAGGDGVTVVSSVTGEIESSAPVDDDDDSDTSVLTRRYRLKIAKRLSGAPYKYIIKFHEMNVGKADVMITCDPTIANLEGILKGKLPGKPKFEKPPLRLTAVFTCSKS